MTTIFGLLIAAPTLMLALYIFTRMFDLLNREQIQTPTKVFASMTMFCALATAAVTIIGSWQFASVLSNLANTGVQFP